jgi:hypothetical protein
MSEDHNPKTVKFETFISILDLNNLGNQWNELEYNDEYRTLFDWIMYRMRTAEGLLAKVVDEINQFAMAHSKVEAAGADATTALRADEWAAYMNLLQVRDAAEQAVQAELLSSQNQSGHVDKSQPA